MTSRTRTPDPWRGPGGMRADTRKLLVTGGSITAAGALATALLFLVFGPVTPQGPTGNGGWLCLMAALGCLPTGLLTLVLAFWKWIGDRGRAA